MLSGVQPRTANQILSQRQLAAEVCRLAGRPAEWVSRVRLDAEGRWYEQIHAAHSYELWLISWLPGHTTGFHDHGGANGAFSVVWGALDECVVPRSDGPRDVSVRLAGPGVVRSFGPHYIHDVRNTSKDSVAVSIHAYSPPLTAMTRYDLTPGGLVVAATETPGDW
jgi:predicted metal-dependent enzyme (double-stranded beta helix superfamily)